MGGWGQSLRGERGTEPKGAWEGRERGQSLKGGGWGQSLRGERGTEPKGGKRDRA